MKKLVELAVEGAKVFDLVVEGDKGIEAGAATVFTKKAKARAVPKGKGTCKRDPCGLIGIFPTFFRNRLSYLHFSQQCSGSFLPAPVRQHYQTSFMHTNAWVGLIPPLR
jgi:hypothetical protein